MFAKDDVINEARRRYGKAVCIDSIDDAIGAETFTDAVNIILIDTVRWDSLTGNPLDKEIWENIKE